MNRITTILLVDDDADDRELFFDAAREVDSNIHCIGAANGQQALDYLHDTGNLLPDLIFLDLRMPGLSGRQCLAGIKADPRLSTVPVIVYTTSTEVKDSIDLKKMGAAHFMSKPVAPEDIYYMLSVVLSEKWV